MSRKESSTNSLFTNQADRPLGLCQFTVNEGFNQPYG